MDDELKRIQRDIETILEGNRLDWLHIAREQLSGEERAAMKQGIHARTEVLQGLLERKWALQKGRK